MELKLKEPLLDLDTQTTKQCEAQEEQEELFFLQIQPSSIGKDWPTLRKFIQLGFGPGDKLDEVSMTNILNGLLEGELQCWSLSTKDKVKLLAVTQGAVDKFVNRASLVIYSIVSLGQMSEVDWRFCFGKLKQFAASKGCDKLVAYTRNPKVVQIVEMLGGYTGTRFLEMEV